MKNQPESRTQQIGVRINAIERKAIEAAAAADQRKLSDWARLALLRAAHRRSRRKVA